MHPIGGIGVPLASHLRIALAALLTGANNSRAIDWCAVPAVGSSGHEVSAVAGRTKT